MTVQCITTDNLHHFDNDIMEQFHLSEHDEHKQYIPSIFKETYDVHAASLILRDCEHIIRGCAQLVRTSQPYLLTKKWPLFLKNFLTSPSDIMLVGTHFYVEENIDSTLRQSIIGKLICASLEVALLENAINFVCIMPIDTAYIISNYLCFPVTICKLDDELILHESMAIITMNVSVNLLLHIRQKMGISGISIAMQPRNWC